MKKQATYYAKPKEIEHHWHIIDAEGKTLGRLASRISTILKGKHKPMFTPSMDTGDFVIVTNSDKITVTGNKSTDKVYYRHTGYTGGLKETTFKEQMAKDSTKVIYDAIKGMLPNNRLGRKLMTKVKIYPGPDHPHEAQEPTELTLN